MNLQATKLELIKLILSVENPRIIQRIAKLLQNETSDFWHDLTEEQKAEIQLGIKQIDEGNHISWDEFLKKVS